MFDVAKRLEVLKYYYDNELEQSNPSKLYLDDLQGSIDYCEKLLQNSNSKEFEIIKNVI